MLIEVDFDDIYANDFYNKFGIWEHTLRMRTGSKNSY